MKFEIILLFISGTFLAIGAYRWRRGSHLLRHGKRTTTIVLDNKIDHRGRTTFYYPIVELITEDKKLIAVTLNTGYESPLPHGTRLKIIYDPDDLTVVETDSRKHLEIIPRVFVVAGLCGLVFVLLEVLDVIQLLD